MEFTGFLEGLFGQNQNTSGGFEGKFCIGPFKLFGLRLNNF